MIGQLPGYPNDYWPGPILGPEALRSVQKFKPDTSRLAVRLYSLFERHKMQINW